MNEAAFLQRIETLMRAEGDKLAAHLSALIQKHEGKIMSDLTKLTAAVTALQAQAVANTKAIDDLVALAQANGADQSAIDAITANVVGVSTQLATDDAQDPTAANPPAPASAPAPSDGSTPTA